MNAHIENHSDTDLKTEVPTIANLSVVVPIYNESETLAIIVEQLLKNYEITQIILVNDGSDQPTTCLINELASQDRIEAIHLEKNHGKGFALRTGFAQCRGDIVAIQDADLEYDPNEFTKLCTLILNGEADVVYGSRFQEKTHTVIPFSRLMANSLLTKLSNWMTGLKLSDMETCYKLMRIEVLEQIQLVENRFGIEPELTAKIAKQGWRVAELPISYKPRSYAQGKKIGLRDGLRAIWCIWKYSR